MANELGRHKPIDTVSWIVVVLTAVLVVFAVLAYFYPPDPGRPIKLDFLSKSITITTWFAFALAVLVVAMTVIVTRTRIRRSVPSTVSPRAPAVADIFAVHPTLLERATTPQKGIGYPAKLRLSLENTSGQSLRVLPLSWLTSEGNISVQCGAAPYPAVEYREEMMEFCFRY